MISLFGADAQFRPARAGMRSTFYRFSRADAIFGYRHLEYDFDEGDVFDDLDLSGPVAGVEFRF
jgi:hypothetical protein